MGDFLISIFTFLNLKYYIYKGFSNIYNNNDKAYHGILPFFIWNNFIFACKIGKYSNIYNNRDRMYQKKFPSSIWNTFIFAWKIYKGFSNIYNNRDKAYHRFFHFLFAILLFLVEKCKIYLQIFITTMIKPFMVLF